VTNPAPSEPRGRILAAAKQVFGANGYRGGSLNEVATRAGYTRAGLLHHFPSKESMLLALLELRDERLENFSPHDPARTSIFTVVDELPDRVRVILEDPLLIKLAHALTAEASEPEHPAHEWVAQRQRRLRENLAASVAHSVRLGELPESVDAQSLAALILAVVEGIEAQWLIDESVDPVRAAETLQQLLRALRIPAEARNA
jgi:AcrR family transcriptional regulator